VSSSDSRAYRLALAGLVLVLGALLGLLVVFRAVSLDEGVYLWAGKLVYEGQRPYVDFTFPQTPLLPYVYGLLGRPASLLAGRLFTVALALVDFLLAGYAAGQLGGPRARLLALTLCAVSLFSLAHFAYSATYAVAAFFMLAALALALFEPARPAGKARVGGWGEMLRLAGAGLLLGLAVGARLSVLAALPALVALAALRGSRAARAGLAVCAGAGIGLLAVLAPFLLADPGVTLYNILGFHTDRLTLAWRVETLRRALGHSLVDFAPFVLLLGGAALAWAKGAARQGRARLRRDGPTLAVGAWALLLFAAHLAPRQADSYHQSLLLPLASILGGVILARAGEMPAARRHAGGVAGALAAVLALWLGHQAWTILRWDLIQFPLQDQLAPVREAGAYLDAHAEAGSRLLAFQTQLALESHMAIPHGWENSYFGYRPEWSTERARQTGVLNNELLLEDLRAGAGAVALTSYDAERVLYGDRDAIFAALQENYRLSRTIPGIGPFRDPLTIYLPHRSQAPAPAVSREAELQGGIRLRGYELLRRRGPDGQALWLTLQWQAPAERPAASYVVFVHVLRPDGSVAVGWDNPPCRRTCPTDTWQPGEVIDDEYTLNVEGLPAGAYTLEAGMYHAGTSARLEVAGGEDRIVLGTVELAR